MSVAEKPDGLSQETWDSMAQKMDGSPEPRYPKAGTFCLTDNGADKRRVVLEETLRDLKQGHYFCSHLPVEEIQPRLIDFLIGLSRPPKEAISKEQALALVNAREFCYCSAHYRDPHPVDIQHPGGYECRWEKFVVTLGRKADALPIAQKYAEDHFGEAVHELFIYPRTYVREARALIHQGAYI